MNKDQQNMIDNQEDLTEVLKVRREKLAKLQEMGKDPFVQSKYERTHYSVEIKDNFEEMEGKVVKIAGRIMSKRLQGKAGFIDIQDQEGRIQCYVRKDRIYFFYPLSEYINILIVTNAQYSFYNTFCFSRCSSNHAVKL